MSKIKSNHLGLWHAFLATGLFLAIAVISFILAEHFGWAGHRQATCLQSFCFCENDRNVFPREVINSWSSLIYVAAGLYLLFSSRVKNINASKIQRNIALIMVLIGVGSFFYHATMTFLGQFFDFGSMFILISYLLYVSVRKFAKISPVFLRTAGLALLAFLLWLLYVYPETRRWTFALLLVAWLLVEQITLRASNQKAKLMFFLGFGTFVLSYVIWTLDEKKIVCWPSSAPIGHALWHTLTAMSVILLTKYYCFDKLAKPVSQS